MGKFKDFLEESLTAAVYLRLAARLKITKNKLARILRDPASMNLGELRTFAEVLSVPALDLMDAYDCGAKTITIWEKEQLAEERRKMEEVQNAE